MGARAWGLRELSLAPARLSCLRVRFCDMPCTRGRGLLAATATLPFGRSLLKGVYNWSLGLRESDDVIDA